MMKLDYDVSTIDGLEKLVAKTIQLANNPGMRDIIIRMLEAERSAIKAAE